MRFRVPTGPKGLALILPVLRTLALVALALVVGLPAEAAMSDVCKVPAGMLHTPFPRARVREKLRHGAPLTVVAIGSSSTAGTGASSERANYPSRLAAELREMFPRSRVTVINRG